MILIHIFEKILNKELPPFSFDKSLKTKSKNDFLNLQAFLYPGAKTITRFLYYTNITPHQVIFISLVFGITSAFLIINDNIYLRLLGGVLLFYKNVLDKVDGSLARAKKMVSRRGRFYDSISDFIVSLFVFSSIGYYFYSVNYPNIFGTYVLLAFISSMLQCSYFIYYEVSFIKYSGKETINRLTETVTEDDKKNQDKFTLFLQRIFLDIYGWQDNLFLKLDRFLFYRLMKKLMKIHSYPSDVKGLWYYNRFFLTLASSLCIGTHMVLIPLFSVFRNFEIYLYINLAVMNIIMVVSVFYHYFSSIILKKS